MYTPDRKPAAHQVAASQDKNFKGCHVYVESGNDCRFWKTFLDMQNIKLRACNGWSKVVESVNNSNAASVICIGIIDRDFRDYVDKYDDLPDNVFMSDEHDVEMTIVKAVGIERVINNFDAADHIQKYEQAVGAKVLEVVLDTTNRIGILKLIDRRDGLKLKLRKPGKGTEFELPDYERFLDKNGRYSNNKVMVNYLMEWSRSNKSQPVKSNEEVLALYEVENMAQYDTYKLSCGHDVMHVIAILIRKYISGERTDKDELEKLLRASYSWDDFKSTDICASLKQWGTNNGISILREG